MCVVGCKSEGQNHLGHGQGVAKLTSNEKPMFSLVHGQGGQNEKVGKTMLKDTLTVPDLMHSLTIAGLKLSTTDGELKVCGDVSKLTQTHKQSLSHHKDTIKLLLQPVEVDEDSQAFKIITVCIERQICDECGSSWLDIMEHDYRCGVCNSVVRLTPNEIFWPTPKTKATGGNSNSKDQPSC